MDWKNHTIASLSVSDAVEWRAQESVSPSGLTMRGIRKFIKRKTSDTWVPTNDAIMAVIDPDVPDKGPKQLKAIAELLMQSATFVPAGTTHLWYLVNKERKCFVTSDLRSATSELAKAAVFTSKEDAEAALSKKMKANNFVLVSRKKVLVCE